MTAQRLSQIIRALMRAKQLGAKLTGKSDLERQLNAWINSTTIPLVYDWEPRPAQPAPVRYEDEYFTVANGSGKASVYSALG